MTTKMHAYIKNVSVAKPNHLKLNKTDQNKESWFLVMTRCFLTR